MGASVRDSSSREKVMAMTNNIFLQSVKERGVKSSVIMYMMVKPKVKFKKNNF
jgi:hypothetical protein